MIQLPTAARRLLSKIQVIVIRVGGQGKTSIINSKPCAYCISYMRRLGIKRVHYSTDDNILKLEKVSSISSTHESTCRKIIQGSNNRLYTDQTDSNL